MTDKYKKLYKHIKDITEFLEKEKIGGMKGTFVNGWHFSFKQGPKKKKAKLTVSQ